jgi:membrane-associated phospholipid phosphatase
MIDCTTEPCDWYVYQPGLLEQDLVTLPLLAAAVGAISVATQPPEEPLWPFRGERNTRQRAPSRQPGYLAAGMGAAAITPFAAYVWHESEGRFAVWTHARGLIHAHLLTELVTISSKNFFGRRRPFYDTAEAQGGAGLDARRSFFSGHASHGFALAAYGMTVAWREIENPAVAATFSGLFALTAGWLASSRAFDGQHHWSDVAMGAAVGSSIGYWVGKRVNDIASSPVEVNIGPTSVQAVVRF